MMALKISDVEDSIGKDSLLTGLGYRWSTRLLSHPIANREMRLFSKRIFQMNGFFVQEKVFCRDFIIFAISEFPFSQVDVDVNRWTPRSLSQSEGGATKSRSVETIAVLGMKIVCAFEIYENWYTKKHRKQKTTHRTLLAKRSVSNWHIRIKKQNTQGNDAILAIWKRWNIIGFILSPRGRSLSRTIVHWLSKYTRAAAWLEALFHSRSRIVPDHWPEKQKKESLHQQTTLDHMLWQSRRTHLQAEKKTITRFIHVPNGKDNASLQCPSRAQLHWQLC